MARKKPEPEPTPTPESEKPKRTMVDIDPDLARKASVIAAARGISLPSWINNRLRPIIDRELPEVLRELGQEG